MRTCDLLYVSTMGWLDGRDSDSQPPEGMVHRLLSVIRDVNPTGLLGIALGVEIFSNKKGPIIYHKSLFLLVASPRGFEPLLPA